MGDCAVDVSVILPIYNAEPWLEECLQSIYHQKIQDLKVELSAFFDSCNDRSSEIFQKWTSKFLNAGFKIAVSSENNENPKGVGYSRNKATIQSCGRFLCFMDSDDVMEHSRILKQYETAKNNENAIVGCRFTRNPANSTARFTSWANSLSELQLNNQIFTSHGPTVIMPTWFCSRKVIEKCGLFDESGRGTPEDLLFFLKHIGRKGIILRCPQELLVYRYHLGAATFSVHQNTIWRIRVEALESRVLNHWSRFTIWNGGKQGRKFYRSLSDENRRKVSCFCDVDAKKIGTFYTFELFDGKLKPKVPIVHFKDAQAPFIICIKMNLTGGQFEQNLSSLNLTEGIDYHHFN